ncbi:acetyl-CoA carboxylase biotin carboxylase subunit [uncultured Ferrimonas sp.]|uniref:acetyl/propionyl/methylcrotonyl-CoA carboxylase subunit alpha n=1 Tax=uncultured Ferrimonas sp. TaxID=432640 RepID=UPI002635FF1F|nr:acetyl-CoA carboxylase biotin carboxylase subunit [uncultured Ferrimonas sp.]
MAQFSSVLVANRGEIAVRVLTTAKAQGYRTIAVYSEADVDAPHVQLADEAILIGAAAAHSSYLSIEAILTAAQRSGAEAIHPGYGFLSENAEFARQCAAHNIVFIGPSPTAIELMGNKAAAKRRMLAAQVPCIRGYQGEAQDDASLHDAASSIGTPLMVKAAAGGGGRGMRLINTLSELSQGLQSARSEALSAFGSDELILEQAVVNARHVEVQVFGDSHGNIIHLGERDCSVQRRHQKVVEEAPCPVVDSDLRAALGAAAVAAAKSIDYQGAGTVEFLLDEQQRFYFLEMNTRLQVEHPVTEMITGLDLVALQLQVAQGQPLGLTQADIRLNGHAVEVRLYAEDCRNGYLPASGQVSQWRPYQAQGVRFDSGIAAGQQVSPYYDPMLAKIIAHGADRAQALRRLQRALHCTQLFGISSNQTLLSQIVVQPQFVQGLATTAFIGEHFAAGQQPLAADHDPRPGLAQLAAVLLYRASAVACTSATTAPTTAAALAGLAAPARHYQLACEAQQYSLQITALAANEYQLQYGDDAHRLTLLHDDGCQLRVLLDGHQFDCGYHSPNPAQLVLQQAGHYWSFVDALAESGSGADQGSQTTLLAPMHGTLLALMVAEGDSIRAGQTLAVMEAMKMEHSIKAAIDGTVAQVHAKPNQQLAAGSVLIELDAAGECNE